MVSPEEFDPRAAQILELQQTIIDCGFGRAQKRIAELKSANDHCHEAMQSLAADVVRLEAALRRARGHLLDANDLTIDERNEAIKEIDTAIVCLCSPAITAAEPATQSDAPAEP